MSTESEIEAREIFASKNLDVVGWYHSHPTFEPNPSIRDIENQGQYQVIKQYTINIIYTYFYIKIIIVIIHILIFNFKPNTNFILYSAKKKKKKKNLKKKKKKKLK